MNTILAVDPGLKGGIVVMGEDGSVIHTEKMPVLKVDGKGTIDLQLVAKTVRTYQPRLICIEQVHAMPGQGVSSVFTFGMGFGGIKGVAAALDIPLATVRPLTWQKVVLGAIDKNLGKARSQVYCKQRYPHIEPAHKHDGIADAVCIAEWAIKNAI